MKRDGHHYRLMLRQDHKIRGELPEDWYVMQMLETYWNPPPNPASSHRADPLTHGAWKCLACAGFLSFGRLDYLLQTLELISQYPEVVFRKPSGPYQGAIRDLIPFPPDLDPLVDPVKARTWVEANIGNLRWSESDGLFVLSPL